jgi:hypothetical protein
MELARDWDNQNGVQQNKVDDDKKSKRPKNKIWTEEEVNVFCKCFNVE